MAMPKGISLFPLATPHVSNNPEHRVLTPVIYRTPCSGQRSAAERGAPAIRKTGGRHARKSRWLSSGALTQTAGLLRSFPSRDPSRAETGNSSPAVLPPLCSGTEYCVCSRGGSAPKTPGWRSVRRKVRRRGGAGVAHGLRRGGAGVAQGLRRGCAPLAQGVAQVWRRCGAGVTSTQQPAANCN